jgi:hypothetical protein
VAERLTPVCPKCGANDEVREYEVAGTGEWYACARCSFSGWRPSALRAEAPSEPLCKDCGRSRNDSSMHLEAPGTNWGAALHSFVPPSEPTAAPLTNESLCEDIVDQLVQKVGLELADADEVDEAVEVVRQVVERSAAPERSTRTAEELEKAVARTRELVSGWLAHGAARETMQPILEVCDAALRPGETR